MKHPDRRPACFGRDSQGGRARPLLCQPWLEAVELKNSVLNHTANMKADDADAAVTLSHETLNIIIFDRPRFRIRSARAMGRSTAMCQSCSRSLSRHVRVLFNIIPPPDSFPKQLLGCLIPISVFDMRDNR